MTHLSVNLNRVALLRNSRDIDRPHLLKFAQLAIEAGAHGITVHPRPDQRHIRVADVHDLSHWLKQYSHIEFNMEGNPFSGGVAAFLPLVFAARPQQVTLVPDSDAQATSDHGWDLKQDGARLAPIVAVLKAIGARVSLFMDADADAMGLARATGADRIELYTKPLVDALKDGSAEAGVASLSRFAAAAEAATTVGLGVNAGHDLNLDNLPALVKAIPNLAEVSIGHALMADALEFGLAVTVRKYLEALAGT
jgi:pyridoxine 5-phosphate synthase